MIQVSDGELLDLALKAREYSYSPYSHFAVGAALLSEDGKVYQGCNIENASYSATNCAERTAFFKAISEGTRKFSKIAIVGGEAGKAPTEIASPCGVCRQVMREFCDPETFQVVLGTSPEDAKSYLLKELLPLSFGPENLLN